MTDHDDDDGADDPQLSSLRAVWLSMPDEEPPQRGLAELTADELDAVTLGLPVHQRPLEIRLRGRLGHDLLGERRRLQLPVEG